MESIRDAAFTKIAGESDSQLLKPFCTGSSKHCGCFMISRAAMWNPSIFADLKHTLESPCNLKSSCSCTTYENTYTVAPLAKDKFPVSSFNNIVGTNSLWDTERLLALIVELSAAVANCPANTRYLMQQIIGGARLLYSPLRASLRDKHDLSALSSIFGKETLDYVSLLKEQQKTMFLREYHANLSDVTGSVVQPEILHDRCLPKAGVRHLDTTIPMASKVQSVSLATPINTAYSNHVDADIDIFRDTDVFCTQQLSKYREANWPGVVSLSSHQYDDTYFDDNYYIAFRKCNEGIAATAPPSVCTIASGEKRNFAYTGFSSVEVSRRKMLTKREVLT